jgi:hypothetical protein
MRMWKRLLASCAAVLFLGLLAEAANATGMGRGGCPGSGLADDPFGLGEVTSGNGQLVFSNFRFHSPSCSVDPSDLVVTILEDGVEIAGPITLSGGGWAKFHVSYDVTAVDPLINGASLALDSSIAAPSGVVFATKRVIGERPDKPEGHPWNDHGWGHLGLGLIGQLAGNDPPQDKTLAFLKTAEWDVEGGLLCEFSLSWLCSGEFRLDEQSFAAQDSVKVIDGVWVKGHGKHSIVTYYSSTNRYSVVPEPATGTLLMLGLLGLAVRRRRL